MKFFSFLSFTLILFFGYAPTAAFVAATHDLAIIYETGHNESLAYSLQVAEGCFHPDGVSSATDLFVTALYQGVPLLVPGPLWKNVVDHKRVFDDFCTKDLNALDAKYAHHKRFASHGAIKRFKTAARYLKNNVREALKGAGASTTFPRLTDALWDEMIGYALLANVPVDRYHVWVIYDQSGKIPFYLFLPKTISLSASSVLVDGLTDRERALGLQIDHAQLVFDPFKLAYIPSGVKKYDDVFVSVLEALFVTTEHYSAKTMPRWNIYMMGHGIYSQRAYDRLEQRAKELAHLERECAELEGAQNGSAQKMVRQRRQKAASCSREIGRLEAINRVCGLPVNDFRKCLTLFDEINTGLLFYKSCSSGGEQSRRLFETPQKLNHSYCIINDSVAEAPSTSIAPAIDPVSIEICDGALVIDSPYDFKRFFDLGRQRPSAQVLRDMMFSIGHVYDCKQSLPVACAGIKNIHTVKLPGHEPQPFDIAGCFICVNKQGASCAIGKGDAVTILFEREIGVIDCSGVSLFPSIISGIPGTSMHIIDHISSPNSILKQVLDGFFVLPHLNVAKMFVIKELACKNEAGRSVNLKNVMIVIGSEGLCEEDDRYPEFNGVRFEQNDRCYQAQWGARETISDNLAFKQISPDNAQWAEVRRFFEGCVNSTSIAGIATAETVVCALMKN